MIVIDMLELVYMFPVSHELLILMFSIFFYIYFIFNYANLQVLDVSVTATNSHQKLYCSQLRQSLLTQFVLNHSHFWSKTQPFVPLDHQKLITQSAMEIQVCYGLKIVQICLSFIVYQFRWSTYNS